MSIRLASLASSSAGNSVYFESAKAKLLIDIGPSYRFIKNEMANLGTEPSEIGAILLTHEHADHILGLPVFLRRHPVPVYATSGTFEAISRTSLFEKLPKAPFHLFDPGDEWDIADIHITSIPSSHDAVQPCVYRLDTEGGSAAVVTDLGVFTEKQVARLTALDLLYLEANHDTAMLETGIYPYPLKLRVAGPRGHLSNEEAGELLTGIWHSGLKQVLLAHLSKENNYPPLARETVRAALSAAGIDPETIKIMTAPEKGLSEILTV